jgi:hypothetical protein
MNAINEIKKRLKSYPDIQYKIVGNKVTVFPSSEEGFPVQLTDNGNGYTVQFGNMWHEEFVHVNDALNCFVFGLSDHCRLKITYRGRFAQAWTVEEMDEEGAWEECSWIGCCTTGLLVPPFFWLRKSYKYLHNSMLIKGTSS